MMQGMDRATKNAARVGWGRVGRWAGGIALGVLALGAAADDAAACDCAVPSQVTPSQDDAEVPANTKIWIRGWTPCPSPALQEAGGGAVIETTQSQIARDITVLHPAAPLQVGASYEVSCGSEPPLSTFTVTAEADTTPPGLPSVKEVEHVETGGIASSCGEESYVKLDASFAGKLLLLDIEGEASLDTAALSGVVSAAFAAGEMVFVGEAACSGSNWNLDREDEPRVAYATVDLAGNVSGWTEAAPLEEASGCQMGGPARGRGGIAAAAAALLGLFGLRRRGARHGPATRG